VQAPLERDRGGEREFMPPSRATLVSRYWPETDIPIALMDVCFQG